MRNTLTTTDKPTQTLEQFKLIQIKKKSLFKKETLV